MLIGCPLAHYGGTGYKSFVTFVRSLACIATNSVLRSIARPWAGLFLLLKHDSRRAAVDTACIQVSCDISKERHLWISSRGPLELTRSSMHCEQDAVHSCCGGVGRVVSVGGWGGRRLDGGRTQPTHGTRCFCILGQWAVVLASRASVCDVTAFCRRRSSAKWANSRKITISNWAPLFDALVRIEGNLLTQRHCNSWVLEYGNFREFFTKPGERNFPLSKREFPVILHYAWHFFRSTWQYIEVIYISNNSRQ